MSRSEKRLNRLPDGEGGDLGRAIGELLLNCDAAEVALTRLAEAISRDPGKRDPVPKGLHSGRTCLARELARHPDLPGDLRRELDEILDMAAALSKTRNAVVHNPLVTGAGVNGAPVTGIIDVSKAKGSGTSETGVVGLQDILSSARLALILAERLRRIIARIDHEGESPDSVGLRPVPRSRGLKGRGKDKRKVSYDKDKRVLSRRGGVAG